MNLVRNIFSSRRIQFYVFTAILFLLGIFLANIEAVSVANGWVTFVFLLLSLIPVYYGVFQAVSKKKAIFIIIALSILAWVIEYVGLTTGFPYGNFFYTELAGPKMFGVLPVSVAFAWPPLVLGSYFLFSEESFPMQDIRPIFFLIALDLVIDPAAVEFGLWGWMEGGMYYNVPLVNYLGWLISASIGIWVIDKLVGKKVKEKSIWLFFSVFVNLLFWSGFLLASGMFVPFGISLILLYKLYEKIELPFHIFSDSIQDKK